MKNVIGYARISTQEQAEGNGLEFQQEAITSYCQSNSLNLCGIYTDIASGTKSHRQGLSEILQGLSQYDAVIVYHTDRLSRKLAHLLQLIDTIGKAGKSIISTSQPEFDLNSSTGKLIFSILGAVSEFELSRITERMVLGRQTAKKKANGSNVNYGKRPRYDERKHWDVKSDGTIVKTLVQDTAALQTIELIRRHRRSGKSFRAIARYLNEQQIPSKSGKLWHHKTVKTIYLLMLSATRK